MSSFLYSSAQESISADVKRGCDQLEVNFNMDNARGMEEYSLGITWSFGDGQIAENTLAPTHIYEAPGLYFVSCDIGWAEVKYVDTIIVSETPYVDFSYQDLTPAIAEERSFLFSPEYFTPLPSVSLSYSWNISDNNIRRIDSSQEPIDLDTSLLGNTMEFTFDKVDDDSLMYFFVTLEIEDENGCIADTTKAVVISHKLSIPNVFTPNGDGTNDYFKVSTPSGFIYDFRIVTRDGFLIYKSTSDKIFWDGYSFSGEEAPEGIYFYSITSLEDPFIPTSTKLKKRQAYTGYIHLYR